MLLKAQDENAEIIEKVVAQLRNREPKGTIEAEAFIRQYYSQFDPEDLAERSISNLSGAALAHLDFIEEFKSGTPKAARLQSAKPKRRMGVHAHGYRDRQ